MKAAILSAGPSIARWPLSTFAPYDLRIGVNTACERVACEWACIGDTIAIPKLKPLGEPMFYTTGFHVARPPGPIKPILHRIKRWDELCGHPDKWPKNIWKNFSINAALQLACYLGATAVDVFGHDMAGDLDWSGRMALTAKSGYDNCRKDGKGKRGVLRWKREADRWAATVRLAEKHGVVVTVMRPEALDGPLNAA